MATEHYDIFEALARPFEGADVKTRSGGGGRQLKYITARVAMNRLDTVVGPENWRNTFRRESFAEGMECVVCRIEIKVGGEWIGKEDAGGFKVMTEKDRTGQQVEDEENTVKTAYSDAFKRAAILWGVGRHLYNDGIAKFDPPPRGKEDVHREYNAWLEKLVAEVNDNWLEKNMKAGGEIPNGLQDLTDCCGLNHHMSQWSGKEDLPGHWDRNRITFDAEARAHCRRLWTEAKKALTELAKEPAHA